MEKKDYAQLKYTELKEELRDRDLPSKGKKVELIERLQENDKKYEKGPNEINVHIKTLVGSCYTIKIDKSSTFTYLKDKIQEKNGVPPNKMRLQIMSYDNHMTSIYDEDQTLDDFGIVDGSVLSLHIKLI